MIEWDGAILDALYDGTMDDASLERALVLTSGSLGCVSSALLSVDTHAPANLLVVTGALNAGREAYFREFAAIDPAPAAFARIPIGTASTTLRILPEVDQHSVFANEFYRPLGLAETIGGNLYADRTRSALLGLHRAPDRPPFDDTEIRSVERLMVHIVRALQLRRAFRQLDSRVSALESALGRLPAGVLLLDASGASMFSNAAFAAVIRRADGLSLDRNGRLNAASADARRRLGLLIDDVARGGAGGIVTVPRPGVALPYAVLVARSSLRGPRHVASMDHSPRGRPRRWRSWSTIPTADRAHRKRFSPKDLA